MKKLIILLTMLLTLTSYSQQESLIYPNMYIIEEGGAHIVETPFRIDYYGNNKEINRVEITQQNTGKYTILRLTSEMYLDEFNGETFIVAKYFEENEFFIIEFYQDFKEIILRGKTTTYYFRYE